MLPAFIIIRIGHRCLDLTGNRGCDPRRDDTRPTGS